MVAWVSQKVHFYALNFFFYLYSINFLHWQRKQVLDNNQWKELSIRKTCHFPRNDKTFLRIVVNFPPSFCYYCGCGCKAIQKYCFWWKTFAENWKLVMIGALLSLPQLKLLLLILPTWNVLIAFSRLSSSANSAAKLSSGFRYCRHDIAEKVESICFL